MNIGLERNSHVCGSGSVLDFPVETTAPAKAHPTSVENVMVLAPAVQVVRPATVYKLSDGTQVTFIL